MQDYSAGRHWVRAVDPAVFLKLVWHQTMLLVGWRNVYEGVGWIGVLFGKASPPLVRGFLRVGRRFCS